LRARTPFVPDAGNVIGTNRELVADGQVSERLQIGLAEMIVRNIGHRGRSRSWRALRSASDMAWRICTCTSWMSRS
jgi:hypothetical protein